MTSGPSLAGIGPFEPGLSRPDQINRLLRLHRVLLPSHGQARQAVLDALSDPSCMEAASAAIDALPTLDRRHILSRYGARS